MENRHTIALQERLSDKAAIISLEKGKLPPQTTELEEAVLGAMLHDSRSVDDCMMVIKTPEVFYREANSLVFSAIMGLYADGTAIDMLTVSSRLRSMGNLEKAGGDFYLISLMQKISSGAHIEVHSRLLLQDYIKRQAIRDASVILSTAYDKDQDCLDLLKRWGDSLDELMGQISSGKKNLSYAEGLDLVEKRVEFLTHKDPEEVTGARTGFKVIDLFTGGYQPGELIIDAARPGMGKTAKMLKCALENARIGHGVGIISAEMSAVQLIGRTVAIDTDFHLTQLTKKGFEKQEYFITLSKHKRRMKGFPIYIDDTAGPDIRTVQAVLRMWKRKHDIRIAIIDYLQLLGDSSKSGNREQEIASISRKLKALAKELEIPIIALSQLSRAVETRGSSKRPMLSDLRESGAIEQDADMVCFLYRPEYYGLEVDEEIAESGGNTEVIFAKYRGGAPGTTIALHWQGDKTKFEDPSVILAQQQENNAMPAPLPKIEPSKAFGGNWSIQDQSDNNPPF